MLHWIVEVTDDGWRQWHSDERIRSPTCFLSTFSTFLTYFFPGPVSIEIDTLWAQLLEFLPVIMKLLYICSTWSEDVCVVLGLSSYHIKVTTLYWQFNQKEHIFSYFSTKMYVVGTPEKRLSEALLMSTHNICFLGEKKNKKKNFTWLSRLIWSYGTSMTFKGWI